jgi:RNA polymerase sigma factor (sigma-70 family)
MGIFRHEAVLFRSGTMAGLTDGELLDRFLDRPESGSEAAFETIVARHGPMVMAACLRQLRSSEDAADAFQATFLTLARKARSIRGGGSLGGWLHRVARHASSRARARSARRSEVENLASQGPETRLDDPASTVERDELRALIDEEMGRLPRSFQAPLVLCYLEGLTHDEVAEQLGCPVGTVRSRLARGRDRLRDRLIRRGVAPASCVLGASLPQNAAKAAMAPSLVEVTLQAAPRVAAGQSVATASVAAHLLMEGVIRTMFLKKLRTVGFVFALAGGIGLGAGKLWASNSRQPAPPPIAIQDSPKAAERVEVRGGWDDLKGKWDVVSVEESGRRLDLKEAPFDECLILAPKRDEGGTSSPGWLIFFLDARLFEEWPVTRFDPDASPKTIDVNGGGKSLMSSKRSPGLFQQAGLYKVTRDELTICLGPGRYDQPVRPDKIASEAETGTLVIVLKRRTDSELRELRRSSMEGTWKVVSVEPPGPQPLSPKPGETWIVGPDWMKWMDGDRLRVQLSYRVDEKAADMMREPEAGDFAFDRWAEDRGLTLRFCYGKVRPNFHPSAMPDYFRKNIQREDLNADAEKGSVLVILKRLTDPPPSAKRK